MPDDTIPAAPRLPLREREDAEEAIREAFDRWLRLFRDPDRCCGVLTRGGDPDKWRAMIRARLAYQDALLALAEARVRAGRSGSGRSRTLQEPEPLPE